MTCSISYTRCDLSELFRWHSLMLQDLSQFCIELRCAENLKNIELPLRLLNGSTYFRQRCIRKHFRSLLEMQVPMTKPACLSDFRTTLTAVCIPSFWVFMKWRWVRDCRSKTQRGRNVFSVLFVKWTSPRWFSILHWICACSLSPFT